MAVTLTFCVGSWCHGPAKVAHALQPWAQGNKEGFTRSAERGVLAHGSGSGLAWAFVTAAAHSQDIFTPYQPLVN